MPPKTSTASASQQGRMMEVDKAANVVTQLEKMWNELPHSEGVSRRVAGVANKAKGSIGAAPKVKAYHDFANGVLAPLIRAMGEKGALSDSDVKRAINLIPQYPDTGEESRLKLQALNELITRTRESVEGLGGGMGKSSTPKGPMTADEFLKMEGL